MMAAAQGQCACWKSKPAKMPEMKWRRHAAAIMGYDSKTRVWKCRGVCSKGAVAKRRRREAKARYDARCLELGVDPNTATASGFRGVTWKSWKNKWKARIQLDGKGKHLGFFEATTSGEVDATLAYDAVARVAGRPKAANFQLQAATAPSKVLEEDVHASDFAEESARDHLHLLRDHLHALPAADHATLLLEAEFRPAAPTPAIQGTPVNPRQVPAATNCWATVWHDDEDEKEDEDEGTPKGTGKHYTAWENDFNVLGYPSTCEW